jgi:hypothetical protein
MRRQDMRSQDRKGEEERLPRGRESNLGES